MSSKPAQERDHQCQQVTSDGRRCLMSRMRGHASLCFVHAQRQQKILDPKRVVAELLGPFEDLKTANAVNHALATLFLMVAQNRIPCRNAATLAYIGQLLLQSLPPVKTEIRDAGEHWSWSRAIRQVLLDASQTEAPGQLTQATIEASLPREKEKKKVEEEAAYEEEEGEEDPTGEEQEDETPDEGEKQQDEREQAGSYTSYWDPVQRRQVHVKYVLPQQEEQDQGEGEEEDGALPSA